MTLAKASDLFRFAGLVIAAGVAFCPASRAQATLAAIYPDAPGSLIEPSVVPVPTPAPTARAEHHRFWDKQNLALFAATAALNGADFAVTRANLQSGGQEMNPVVRVFGQSTPALAMNFIGETAGVMSLSYFFHKTGHHRLERAVSVVDLAGSAGAVSYGFAHR